MSTIKIDSHRYNTSRLNEKIKTYDFDETTSVNSLLELINEQADDLISLKTKCLRLEEENKNLTFWKNCLEKLFLQIGKIAKENFFKNHQQRKETNK